MLNNKAVKVAEHTTLEGLQLVRESMESMWNHHAELALAIKTLTGVVTDLAIRYRESEGVPRGSYLTVFQTSATQNQVYKTAQSALNGVIRGLVIGGTGNVTVSLYAPQVVGGSLLIGTFPLGGGSITLPHHIAIADKWSLGISTDASSAGVVALSAWCEPAMLTSEEQFLLGGV